jgi:hypothetical protein
VRRCPEALVVPALQKEVAALIAELVFAAE